TGPAPTWRTETATSGRPAGHHGPSSPSRSAARSARPPTAGPGTAGPASRLPAGCPAAPTSRTRRSGTRTRRGRTAPARTPPRSGPARRRTAWSCPGRRCLPAWHVLSGRWSVVLMQPGSGEQHPALRQRRDALVPRLEVADVWEVAEDVLA